AYPGSKFLHQPAGIALRAWASQYDEGKHRFALDVIGLADHRGFGDARVRDQCRFDLHRAETMARHFQHVIDAPHDPEIAVLIAVRAVAGDIKAILVFLPVSAEVARVVAPDRAQHAGPGLADDQVSARIGSRHRIAMVIDDHRVDARERLR